jgi:hypothetical protein
VQNAGGVVSRVKFLTGRQAADGIAPFNDQNFTSLFGQECSGGQAIVPGTDYNYVIGVIG